jgi:glucose/arabinose dehydrogenase
LSIFVIFLTISFIIFPTLLIFFTGLSYAEDENDKFYPIKNVSLDLDISNLAENRDTVFNASNFSTESNSWSSIYGKEIGVNKDEKYFVVSNMGLNQFAVASHIAIEEYNKTSEQWTQLIQCPAGMDGPLEPNRFVCSISIDKDITKIRPVFKAGWSSRDGQPALTYFGKFFIVKQPENTPIVFDSNLMIQEVFDTHLTTIAMKFLSQNDILIIDQSKGLVYRIINGILTGPLLDVNVTGGGLLGLDSIQASNKTYVFLYYKESGIDGGEDDPNAKAKPRCNCLYRYELADNKLINPKILFNLTSDFTNMHNGGVIRIGPDNNVYLVTGEMDNKFKIIPNKARNIINGSDPDGSSGILRFTVDGNSVKGILGESYPLNHYFAYGIRNSFGMDFDPVTGNLWDTENGDFYGDEINLVEPGFNSGYNLTNGIWVLKKTDGKYSRTENLNPEGLLNFNGSGKYRNPELTTNTTIGPVALTFLNSTKLGNYYYDTMFVSDYDNQNIYNFKLNGNRSGLELIGLLSDKVVNQTTELNSNLFASGMGTIVDMKTGPDGSLYLLNLEDGKIFRVVPKHQQ